MSISSLENFEHLIIYPLPVDDVELNSLADKQVKYFLRKQSKKKELSIVKRAMCKETADRWLKKHTSLALLEEATQEEVQVVHFAVTLAKCTMTYTPYLLIDHVNLLFLSHVFVCLCADIPHVVFCNSRQVQKCRWRSAQS